jgi:hypothetical protein
MQVGRGVGRGVGAGAKYHACRGQGKWGHGAFTTREGGYPVGGANFGESSNLQSAPLN